MSQVTIRHLMSHTGRVPRGDLALGRRSILAPIRADQVVAARAMLPYTELLIRPRHKYRYSNPGIVFLGRIVELLSGEDYEVYVAKNIFMFMPLGMSRSFFDRAPYYLLDPRSHSYERTDQGPREQPFDFDTGITVANGGLNAPLADMARWLAFLIGPSVDRGGQDDGVLKRSSLLEMFKPVIAARQRSRPAPVAHSLRSFATLGFLQRSRVTIFAVCTISPRTCLS